ncbi:MAG: fibronectin type III domain-containing protein [Verrucomicrobiales bacterium]|nr:fibronectin type III domain-containing protein [Verrucomicrobiales bacterium]
MKSNLLPRAINPTLFLLAASLALAEIPRPGIDCGCDRTGSYVPPALGSIAWNALISPRGTYTVEPFQGSHGLVVRQQGNEVLAFGPTASTIGWGFGADERGLVIHSTLGGGPGTPAQHTAWLYDLENPARSPWQAQNLVSEAISVFSPRGRYLLHAIRNAQDRVHLWAVGVDGLVEAWRSDFHAIPRPGNVGQKFGLAAWGFSADAADASFLYLFNTDDAVSQNLVNLPRGRAVINHWQLRGTTEVGFSPCGDLLAVIRYPAQAAEVWLERTLDGEHVVPGADVSAFGYLEARSDFHFAQSANGPVQLATNTAGALCMDIPLEAPYWAAGAKLTASVVGPTSLRLTRPTAHSRGGRILAYEFREDTPTERVLASLPPDETRLEVADLLPDTEYTFSVRARNEAELWSPTPLTVTVTTDRPDAVPAWPLGAALTADQMQETSLHLSWPAAVDDAGVTGYRVYQDGALLADLDAQKRGHFVQNLEIGRTYEFRVQAGDAQDQWSTDGPRLRIATVDTTPPTWPEGSRLHARERDKHQLVLEWTPAEDNVEVYLYSVHVVVSGLPRVFTMTGGTATNVTLTCLMPGQSLRVGVEAGDAAGNWSTDGPRATVSTASGAPECDGGLELASVNSSETPGAGTLALGWTDSSQYWSVADSERPSLSADGRFVAFESIATNLVAHDRNTCRLRFWSGGSSHGFTQVWSPDVFVRDRAAGLTERISLCQDGGEVAYGGGREPDISGDGQYVVFVSPAPDLVTHDNNNVSDLFLRDRPGRTTRRLSVTRSGEEANGPSSAPRISADGSCVAFVSSANNLVSGDDNKVADIFVLDLGSREFTGVSVASDGTRANQASWGPALSADGRFVAFASDASNLVPDDHNAAADVFIHDRQTGETTRVSVSSEGTEANSHSGRVSAGTTGRSETPVALSADGRFVAFDSLANNLVPGDANGVRDVFVHDRESGETTRVSLTSEGLEGPPVSGAPNPSWAVSRAPAISGNGRFVVFLSQAALVPEKRSIVTDVFLHDRVTGNTRRLSACACGGNTEPDHGSSVAVISRDGSTVAFDSQATNIKPGYLDSNWSFDIFVFEQDPGPPDQDGDGTPDAEEMGPEGNDPLYDGDGDGVPDHLQDNVTVRHTLDGQHYFRASTPLHAGLARITPVPIPDPGNLPPGVTLPFGAFTITAFGAIEAAGGELLLALDFPEGVPFNSWYLYGGRPGAPHFQWYEFLYDGRTGAEIDGSHVTLHFVDGDRGDHDLLLDSNLVTQGGPALRSGALAAGLEVEPAEVLLGGWATEAEVALRNSGQRGLVWAVTDPPPPWLLMEPASGALTGGQSSTLRLRVNQDGLAPGLLEHHLVIRSGAGTREVQVLLDVPFALDAGAELTGPCLVMAWRSEPGSAYRVQFSDSLSSLDWRNASDFVIAVDTVTTWTDCRGEVDGRFYRVVRIE